MKRLAILTGLLILLFSSQSIASCNSFKERCDQGCKSAVCKDACSKGQTFCERKGNSCQVALRECQDECDIMDTYEAKSNCYNACAKGHQRC